MENAMVRWIRRSVGLAGLLMVGGSLADNCTATGSNGFIIDSQAAADALNNCTTLHGDVLLQSNDITQITLNGIETIEGNFVSSSCDALQKITAPVLSQISKNFTLTSLPLLSTLEFPLLDGVNGGIYWDTLPDLTDISFGNLTALSRELPGANIDGDISIQNTALTSLAFLNFTHYSNPEMIRIKGNNQLVNINLTGLAWGSNSLAITNNGPSAQIVLPDLRSVGSMAIRNSARIYVPALSETSGNLRISNNSITAFSAPNLGDIGGSFVVENNDVLDDLSLPKLTSVHGNIVVTNNTNLHVINDMNQLWDCQGNITLSGDFSAVSLPSLRSVILGFHLNTTDPDFDCTTFDKLSSSSSWSSSFYSCTAISPNSSTDTAKHYDPPSNDFDLSKPVKAIIIILSVIAGLFVLALGARFYAKRKGIGGRGSGGSGNVMGFRGVEEGIDLGDAGGVVRQGEGGEELPKYRRVGKPGEVPPGYTPSDAVSSPAVAENVSPEPVNSERERDRRWWVFW